MGRVLRVLFGVAPMAILAGAIAQPARLLYLTPLTTVLVRIERRI
jgi:hypothetical protein